MHVPRVHIYVPGLGRGWQLVVDGHKDQTFRACAHAFHDPCHSTPYVVCVVANSVLFFFFEGIHKPTTYYYNFFLVERGTWEIWNRIGWRERQWVYGPKEQLDRCRGPKKPTAHWPVAAARDENGTEAKLFFFFLNGGGQGRSCRQGRSMEGRIHGCRIRDELVRKWRKRRAKSNRTYANTCQPFFIQDRSLFN